MPRKNSIAADYFETILYLSKNKDKAGLSGLVADGISVDTFKGKSSPIISLAREGDFESVEFLINNFNASLHDAVYGYALGGHKIRVENLLSRGACLNHAVMGYAHRRSSNKVEDLIMRGASLDFAVLGYALAGCENKVEKLLTRGASKDYAIQGYACRGYFDNVENLITRGANIDAAVYGYARGRHRRRVDNLIARRASKDEALAGYARGGHVDEVVGLLERGASKNFAADNFARAGRHDLVEKMLSLGADINSAIIGYARSGQADMVGALLARAVYVNAAIVHNLANGMNASGHDLPMLNEVNIKNAIRGYTESGHFSDYEMVLRLLTFTGPLKYRKILARAAKETNPSLDPGDLLHRAAKINQLMKESRMNYHEARSYLTAWMMPGLHCWFLQGSKLVKNNVMPMEIYILISSYVVGMPDNETIALFNKYFSVMPQKLCEVSIKKTRDKFTQTSAGSLLTRIGFNKMTPEKYQRKLEAANERCRERLHS